MLFSRMPEFKGSMIIIKDNPVYIYKCYTLSFFWHKVFFFFLTFVQSRWDITVHQTIFIVCMQKLTLEWLDFLKSLSFTKKTWFQVSYFVIYFAVTFFYYFYFSNGGIWENTANFKGDSALSQDDKWISLSVLIMFFSYFLEKQLNCSFCWDRGKLWG